MARSAIILVHGTFASDAAWVDEESPLSRKLKEAFPDANLHAFRWSGANAHWARIEAGYELSSTILQIHRETDATEFWLIGHSHGGNVILYALRDQQVPPLVARIAFLGTPFLKITRIDAGWVTSFLKEDETGFLDDVETGDPSIPVFVATVTGDEALRHLTGVDFFSAGLWLTATSALAGAVLMAFVAMFLSQMTNLPSPADSAMPLWIVGPLIFLAPVAWVLVSRALRGSSAGFGGESLSIASTLRVAARALPPWPLAVGSRVRRCDVSPDAIIFRHSTLYADAGVISDLSDWLAAPLDRRDPREKSVSSEAPRRPRTAVERLPLRPAIFGALAMALALMPAGEGGRDSSIIETVEEVVVATRPLSMRDIAIEVFDRFAEAIHATRPPVATSHDPRVAALLAAAVERTKANKGWDLAFDPATGLLTASRLTLGERGQTNLFRHPLLTVAIRCRRPPSLMTESDCPGVATGGRELRRGQERF